MTYSENTIKELTNQLNQIATAQENTIKELTNQLNQIATELANADNTPNGTPLARVRHLLHNYKIVQNREKDCQKELQHLKTQTPQSRHP